MRKTLGLIALVACRDSAPPPSTSAPSAPAVVVAVDAPPPIDAAVDAAPVRTGLPMASLVLDSRPSKRIVVTPRGAVTIDSSAVELDKLAAKLPRPRDVWRAPGSTSRARDQLLDGMLWIRVPSLVHRPLMIADNTVPAIRVFEVARAAEPIGAAIAVVDASGQPRAFGYRVIDPRDHDTPHIDRVAEIEIDRRRILVGDRELPLTATSGEITAAVVATQATPSDPTALRWGFIRLEGAKTPISFAITAMEAMAAVEIVGISFIAGEPGKPHVDVESSDLLARRYLRRHRQQVLRCYEQWLAAHPETGGHLELAWSVGADGVAKSPRVTQVGLDDGVASCVTAVVAAIEIPKQVGPTLIVSLWLEPDGG